MEGAVIVTKRPDVGDVIAFSPNISLDHGNSTAQDVKPPTSKSIDLGEALDNFVPNKKGNGMVCSVKRTLDALDEPTRNKLLKIMENPNVLSLDLTNLLKSHGYNISAEVMRRHRRRANGGGCSCPV